MGVSRLLTTSTLVSLLFGSCRRPSPFRPPPPVRRCSLSASFFFFLCLFLSGLQDNDINHRVGMRRFPESSQERVIRATVRNTSSNTFMTFCSSAEFIRFCHVLYQEGNTFSSSSYCKRYYLRHLYVT